MIPADDGGETGQCPACGSLQIETVDPVGFVCDRCGWAGGQTDEATDNVVDSTGNCDRTQADEWADHYAVTNSTEKQVAKALEILEEYARQLNVSAESRQRAAEVYGSASVDNVTDGRRTEEFVAGCLVMGTRSRENAIPVNVVGRELGVDTGKLRQSIRAVHRQLDDLVIVCEPRMYIGYLARVLSLTDEAADQVEQLTETITNRVAVGGKSPVGFAAAGVYLTRHTDKTQRQIARASGITEETVRVRLREAREVL